MRDKDERSLLGRPSCLLAEHLSALRTLETPGTGLPLLVAFTSILISILILTISWADPGQHLVGRQSSSSETQPAPIHLSLSLDAWPASPRAPLSLQGPDMNTQVRVHVTHTSPPSESIAKKVLIPNSHITGVTSDQC